MPDEKNSSNPSGRAGRSSDVSGNVALAWCSIATGAVTGLVLSLWSFHGPVPIPPGIGSYADLSRRLLRLGHIAFFGLGILNIMLARQLSGEWYDQRRKHLALVAMNFGNLFLPVTLIGAAFWLPLKYLASVPALAVTLALAIAAHAAVSDHFNGKRR